MSITFRLAELKMVSYSSIQTLNIGMFQLLSQSTKPNLQVSSTLLVGLEYPETLSTVLSRECTPVLEYHLNAVLEY